MSPILIAGTTIVNIALLFYTLGIITEQRKRIISKSVLSFIIIGVFFDITATFCMVIGSTHSALS